LNFAVQLHTVFKSNKRGGNQSQAAFLCKLSLYTDDGEQLAHCGTAKFDWQPSSWVLARGVTIWLPSVQGYAGIAGVIACKHVCAEQCHMQGRVDVALIDVAAVE
jgi:hypothetical protein